jgi:hypothetical protein
MPVHNEQELILLAAAEQDTEWCTVRVVIHILDIHNS